MPQFFIILIKINLVLALFSVTYYLILRRLTFYTLNRIFLLTGMLFSTVYPFIDLTDFFHNNPQIAAFVPEINQRVAPADFITRNWQLICTLFYAGVAVMALRLLLQFISLYRLHRNSFRGTVEEMPVRVLEDAVSPFSFWQTIYINPALHHEKDLRSILEHEQVHVKQWHTLDILLAELSVVFYWFNPGIWLMRKAVKENLEFITDEKVLKKGIDKKAYQYSLLEVGQLASVSALGNSFNISDLKKRIVMMNTRRSSRLTLGRYVMVLPVLLVVALLFAVSKREVLQYFEPVIPQLLSSATEKPVVNEQVQVKHNAGNKQGARRSSAVTGRKPADIAIQAVPGNEVSSVSENSRYTTINPGDAIQRLTNDANRSPLKEITVVGHRSPAAATDKKVTGFLYSDTARQAPVRAVGGAEVQVVQGYKMPDRNSGNKD